MKGLSKHLIYLGIISLLVAGAFFNVGWALTLTQVIYWVILPIVIVALLFFITCMFFLDDEPEIVEMAIDQSKATTPWWSFVKIGLIVALMVYAGLVALPVLHIVVVLLVQCLKLTAKGVVNERTKQGS